MSQHSSTQSTPKEASFGHLALQVLLHLEESRYCNTPHYKLCIYQVYSILCIRCCNLGASIVSRGCWEYNKEPWVIRLMDKILHDP